MGGHGDDGKDALNGETVVCNIGTDDMDNNSSVMEHVPVTTDNTLADTGNGVLITRCCPTTCNCKLRRIRCITACIICSVYVLGIKLILY